MPCGRLECLSRLFAMKIANQLWPSRWKALQTPSQAPNLHGCTTRSESSLLRMKLHSHDSF